MPGEHGVIITYSNSYNNVYMNVSLAILKVYFMDLL